MNDKTDDLENHMVLPQSDHPDDRSLSEKLIDLNDQEFGEALRRAFLKSRITDIVLDAANGDQIRKLEAYVDG